MRLLQVTVPTDDRDAVVDVLESADVDFVEVDATDDAAYDTTVFVPLPTEAVEAILEDLTDAGVRESGHLVVLSAETILSEEFEELQARYEAAEGGDEGVAFEELGSTAWELLPEARTFVLLSVVSAVVATAGLLLDAPAIVVGSMVIAPLIGPAMATGVGTVSDDRDLFRAGVRYQVAGAGLVLVGAVVFAAVARGLFLVPPNLDVWGIDQIAGRLSPDLLTLAVAIGSGIAGARSLTSDVEASLVGVMIAAALVPPAAAVGIGAAWLLPRVVVNAGIQLLVNLLAINLAALVTLWYAGYRPAAWDEEARAAGAAQRRAAALVVGILLLGTVLAAFTLGSYRGATTDEDVRTEVAAVLDDPAYDDLVLVETEIRRDQGGLVRDTEPATVVVTVARPDGTAYPALAERLAEAFRRDAGVDADVEVRYVEVDRAG